MEMHELIARSLAGEASDLDERRLARWRSLSGENEEAYQGSKAVWQALSGLDDVEPARRPDADAIVREAERRRRSTRRAERVAAALRSRWGLVAAALVLVSSLIVLADFQVADAPDLAVLDATVGSGDAVTMTLSDGTLVRTAATSRVEIMSSGAPGRNIRLDGRAFFAVAEGDAPFLVHTEAGRVAVTGTRFELVTDGASTRVVTVEGAVRVDDGALEVRAGQVAYLSRGEPPMVVEYADPWSLLEWEGGLLLFQNTPLGDVAREVERHFGTSLRVDPGLAPRRITAWFDGQSLEETVSALCLIAGATCSIAADGARLRLEEGGSP